MKNKILGIRFAVIWAQKCPFLDETENLGGLVVESNLTPQFLCAVTTKKQEKEGAQNKRFKIFQQTKCA